MTANDTSASRRPRVFSGMQPSGAFHLGNYLGALKQWVHGQDEKENFFCIVDLHSLTVQQDPAVLRQRTREFAAMYIAAGINPDRCALFIQSHVAAHAEGCWLLNSVTPVGWLQRMTQYKEKSGRRNAEQAVRTLMAQGNEAVQEFVLRSRSTMEDIQRLLGEEQYESAVMLMSGLADQVSAQSESVSTALLDYPVLMAVDILLYDTTEVPVGEDQKQHVELTRNIAERFNHLYGETFVVPKPMIPKVGARIMGLDDPSKKMSGSSAHIRGHAVRLLDDPKEIEYVFKRAVTDSYAEIRFSDDADRSGVNNLLGIYKVITGKSLEEVESDFATARGYGDLKMRVAEVVIAELAPIRERYHQLIQDPAELDRLLAIGADRARSVAEPKLREMKEKMGLIVP